jgi:hypothetical protein
LHNCCDREPAVIVWGIHSPVAAALANAIADATGVHWKAHFLAST